MLTAPAARPGFGPAPVLTLNPAAALQRLFTSPAAKGRRITAGFSYIQRIGKSAALDVWYPAALRQRLDALLAQGLTPGPAEFPAEWAALRQFELLQEGGNVKIYDLDATHLTRSLLHLARDMRAGGYRVTVASIGSYSDDTEADDLHILDRRLQDRLSRLLHMLYLEDESARRNVALHRALALDGWDYRTALPHIGATLGARDLFSPTGKQPASAKDRKHRLARQFFSALSLLPSQHIVHDTAIGLQLPEAINENEWIYVSPGDETLAAFNRLLGDVFTPFDRLSLGALQGRADAGSEPRASTQHLRGTGDRLTPGADAFYRGLAHYAL